MKCDKKNQLPIFLMGAGLGLAAFLLLYGFSPLDVTNDAFLRGGYVEKDIQQHYAGWLFYRQSPLSLPFCVTDSINWPQGLSVAFTDSIPLFAAFFRLLEPLLPASFQYFGLYTLLCFVLQGGFAALLVSLFTSKPAFALLGSLPFVFSPILLERAFRHTSLAAHFLILGALYYYFLGRRQNRFAYKGLFALNCLALALHPYFVPMTYALTFALLLEYAVRNRSFARPVLYLGGNLAATAAVGWLFGLFGSSGSGSGGSGISYGYFCMNLNSLWNPVSLGTDWSLVLPTQNQTLGNYDGFNYLGLGMLLACFGALLWTVLNRKRLRPLRSCREHIGLLLVCFCLTVFAVSNVITANGAVLARLPLPQIAVQLATTLRSSGRLFWPVYYLIFISCIAWVFRVGQSLRAKAALPAALACLCAVQLIDLSPALVQKAQSLRAYTPLVADYMTATTPQLSTTTDFWQAVKGRYQHLIALDPLTQNGLQLALYTADAGMTSTDLSFAARYNEEAAARQRAEYQSLILNGKMPADSLFVTEQEHVFLTLADSAKAQGAWCGALTGLNINGTEAARLFVIAPGLADYSHPLALAYDEHYPLHVADYSDDHWDKGVLSLNLANIDREADQNKVVLFYDTPLARRKLYSSSALQADGTLYTILKISDADEGWLMVTLDVADAHVLIGRDLESIQ